MKPACYYAGAFLMIMLVGSAPAAEPFPSTGITATLRFFMELDSNDDDRVSEREYVGDRGGKSRAKARREFRSGDENGDGWLSIKEYHRLADLRPGK